MQGVVIDFTRFVATFVDDLVLKDRVDCGILGR